MQRLMAEAYRLHLLCGLERLLHADGVARVAGVDEAGRGSLAGPVVAAAVIVDSDSLVPGVDDSKRLSAEVREELAAAIRRTATWAVACISADEIDRSDILKATKKAMAKCLAALEPAPDCAVVDAVPLAGLPFPSLPVVRGETLSYSIACASILAKVERDRIMRGLDAEYPQYGFAANKGYGARRHREALSRFGPSPIHRLTFKSVVPREDLGVPRA